MNINEVQNPDELYKYLVNIDSKYISRPRLIKQIQDLLVFRLIILAAPKGYGKTSLLLEFSGVTNIPVCWFQIDNKDKNFYNFLINFIGAISTKFNVFNSVFNDILNIKFSTDQIINIIISKINNEIPEEFILILDNYELIYGNEKINQFVSDLILKTISRFHLIISSNHPITFPDLPIMVARSMVGGMAIEELSFTSDEIKNILPFLSDEEREKVFLSTDEGKPQLVSAVNELLNSSDYESLDEVFLIALPQKINGIILPKNESQRKLQKSKEILTIDSRLFSLNFMKKIKEKPALLYELDPRKFEELIASILEMLGYSIYLTPITRDSGIDIFATTKNDIGSFLYLIECKKYSPNNPVGIPIVKNLYANVILNEANAGLLVTSSYFTRDAKEFKKTLQHRISLKDFYGINKWIDILSQKVFS